MTTKIVDLCAYRLQKQRAERTSGLYAFAAQGAPPDRTESDHHIFTDEELVDLRTLFPEI